MSPPMELNNNMDPLKRFEVGELVFFKEKLCVILSITNKLGFNDYKLMNTDNGVIHSSFGYQLSKTGENSLNLVEEADNICPQQPPMNGSGSRFANLTDDQVDSIADNRTSQNTKRQTQWAVNILKGI